VYSVAVSGTFNLANYGDFRFPILLEHELKKRLGPVAMAIASPIGGPFCPNASKRVARIPRRQDPDFYSRASACHAVVVGGDDIIRFDDEALARPYGISVEEAVASRASSRFLTDLGGRLIRIFAVHYVRLSIGMTTGWPLKSITIKGVK